MKTDFAFKSCQMFSVWSGPENKTVTAYACTRLMPIMLVRIAFWGTFFHPSAKINVF